MNRLPGFRGGSLRRGYPPSERECFVRRTMLGREVVPPKNPPRHVRATLLTPLVPHSPRSASFYERRGRVPLAEPKDRGAIIAREVPCGPRRRRAQARRRGSPFGCVHGGARTMEDHDSEGLAVHPSTSAFSPPPVPCRALARKGNPSPFPGGKTRGMGLYPFPTPCRVWENGGGKKRFGGGRSQAPSAPGLL
jgi:hypothetical protein